jgi:branched-chain amino acid transport system substrate-binding protein
MTKLKYLFFKNSRLILAEFFLLIIALSAIITLNSESNTVSIAVVTPLSGEQEHVGKNIIKTLNVYTDRINKHGGINGYDLIISPYDTKGNPAISREIAQQIVSENKSIAVIQDFSDPAEIDIQNIYQTAKIPLILPTTNTQETNPWNFQISPTPKKIGRYMANYVKRSLKKTSVTIIQSNEKEHNDLVNSFIKKFTALGGTIKATFILEENNKNLGTTVETIFNTFKQENKTIALNDNPNMLLLATSGNHSISFIIELKDKSINLPIISSDMELNKKFDQYSKENQLLGYFTNGIYTSTNILLDSISNITLPLVYKDYHLKYNDNISHNAMSAVLGVNFVVNSLVKSGIEKSNLQKTHLNIIKGLSKNSWFNDKNKGSGKNIFTGVFEHQKLVTSLSNSRIIPFKYSFNNDKNNVLKQTTTNRYLTDYVYTGISMNKISNINMRKLTYSLDFFLWFRYSDKVKQANDIEFLNANATKSIRLLDLLDKSKEASPDSPFSAKLVENYSINGKTYHRYQIKGNFKTNHAKNYALGQQDAYVKFRHHNTNQYHLSYISDFIHSNQGVFSLEDNKNNNFDVIDNESLTLNYNISYINTSYKTRLGSIKEKQESIKFSEFVSEYHIKPTLSSFRGMIAWINSTISGREDKIDIALMVLLLAVSWAIFIFTRHVADVKSFERTSGYWWFLQLSIIFFIMLFSELVISQSLYDLQRSPLGITYQNEINTLMGYSGLIIEALWWIIPAYYIASAFEQFLWKPIKQRTDAEIPYVLRLAVIALVSRPARS